jgi:alpha-beta hydrolase superfamily lysophospholipase
MASDLERTVQPGEATFPSWDGVSIHYRKWTPTKAPPSRGLVIFHRGHEHAGRVAPLAEALATPDMAVFAWDVRGNGTSEGGPRPPSFSDLVRDVDAFLGHIQTTYGLPLEEICLVAHSLSSVFVCTWIHDQAPPIRGLILITPAFRVKLPFRFAFPLLRLWTRLRPDLTVSSLVTGRSLTSDPAEARVYESDPLIKRELRARVLVDTFDASRRVVDDASAITVPTMVVTGERDRVVEPGLQSKFSSGLSSSRKSHHKLANARHDPLHDKNREEVYGLVRAFVEECFERPQHDEEALQRAEDASWTAYDEWREGGPQHLLLRAFLKTVGRLSTGIRIGLEKGFDSGESLDYAYKNEVHGVTPLGRLLDRIYLHAVGWRAMRQRRDHLRDLIEKAIAILGSERQPIRIFDLASGPGRYVLDVLERHPDAEAMLWDMDEPSLARGRKVAVRQGITRARYQRGDAFDAGALANVTPPPTIAIVSGLYELFPRNNVIFESLQGIARAVPTGGMLIYTNQPWHPHLRFIANVLPNRFGRPWRMRCRSQVEMDHLVSMAGFEKIATRVDRWGIFTVSLARRVSP